MKKYLRVLLVGLLIYLPSLGHTAWPEKPIRMIVPYAAGGGADNTARLIAQYLSQDLGQQILIDNKPGASGVIGADLVAKSAPDGYTVLFDASAFTVNPSLRKLPFDPTLDFVPVALIATAPQILVVPPNAPYKTIAEFLNFARQHPGKLTFASAGGATASHLAGETLNHLGKMHLVHIPYKGGAPALTDLMGEQVSVYFGNAASTLGHVKSGKLRALAVSSIKRIPNLPTVPTLAESGLASFDLVEWNGLWLPKGTAPQITERLSSAVRNALNDASIKDKLLGLGLIPVGNTSQAFSVFVQTEMQRVKALVKARNISVD